MNTTIETHDLPEEEVQLVQKFVAFLRNLNKANQTVPKEAQGRNMLATASFAADWENRSDSLYDNWKERYHVSER